jgi:hypothetical protein
VESVVTIKLTADEEAAFRKSVSAVQELVEVLDKKALPSGT